MSTSTRIAGRLLFIVAAAWPDVRVWNATPAAALAPTVLESPALRLEVTAEPYSYAVIEKSTGQLLLRQAQTTFNVGNARSTSRAVIGRKSTATLEATLEIQESSDTAASMSRSGTAIPTPRLPGCPIR